MGVEERREDPTGTAVDALQPFHPIIRDWFRAELGEPSEPQARAWPEIACGNNVLIVAPTGAGKTLAAFLKCIDAPSVRRLRNRPGSGCRECVFSRLSAEGAQQ